MSPEMQAEQVEAVKVQGDQKKNPPKLHSNFNLEKLLGRQLGVVDDIIDNFDAHVKAIEIPKKDGSKRKLLAPSGALKYIQKGVYWRILRRYKANDAAHGFVAKRGIVTNAAIHVGAKSLGKIDIENFFDSISEKHLKNCLFGNKNICRYCKKYELMLEDKCNPSLYKNKKLNYPHKCEEIKAVYIPDYCEKTGYQSLVARIIQLCTVNGFAAQGFPTSPILANIVLRGFDRSMVEYCEERGVNYTRYADDLAFSSKEMSKQDLKEFIKQKAYRLLWAYNFKPNRKKTIWKSRAGRLRVCGVVVNEKISIQRDRVRKFRAEVHNATVKTPEGTTKASLRKLKGWASYLMSVDKPKGEKYMNQLKVFEEEKFGRAT